MTIDKSKKFLGNALLALMDEKPYSSINIYEIAKKAYVSRTTFYNHFQEKDDVITFIIADAFAPLTNMDATVDSFDFRAFVTTYLDVLKANRKLFLSLRHHNVIHMVPAYIAGMIKQLAANSEEFVNIFGNNADLELFCEYESEITFFCAYWFLNHASMASSSELAEIIYNIRKIGFDINCGASENTEDSNDPSLRLYSGDPRSIKTAAAFHDALNMLLAGSLPQDISVSALTAKAGLSRCSFYRHYSDITDLIEETLQNIYVQTIKSIPCQGHLIGYGKVMEICLQGYEKYRCVFASLAKGNYEMSAMRAYRGILDVLEWQLPYIKNYVPENSFEKEYYQWFLAVDHITPILIYFRDERTDFQQFSTHIQNFRYFPYIIETRKN